MYTENKKLHIKFLKVRKKKRVLSLKPGQEKKLQETGLHNNSAGNNSL
jgi:hypothetical protein